MGLVERCHDGTLFLDEISDLSLAQQAKLLRVLQNRTFNRVGDTTTRASDFRLVAASNQDLSLMVKLGTFREDLFYRINVFPIRLPSLRERADDIPFLIQEILTTNARRVRLDGMPPPRVLPEALEKLTIYLWPGNVRQLENVILRAAVLSGGHPISIEHLPAFEAEDTASGTTSTPEHPAQSATRGSQSLAEVEQEHIALVLKAQNGNLQASAKVLGISRTTLYKKIKQYSILG
jgi:transcriptional regulator with PAS, ATPase and Fis domain